MLRIEFVVAILFLAIGPLRVIPVFHAVTRAADWRYRLRAAAYAVLFAGAMIAVVALVGVRTIENWRVSAAALEVAIGVLLLHASLATLSTLNPANAKALEGAMAPTDKAAPSAASLAYSPLAAPTIVTPTGVVTIVFFLLLAHDDRPLTLAIYVALVAMLVVDFVAMLLAGPIVRFVRITTLEIIGWLFAAMQAALAIEALLGGLAKAGFGGH